MLRARNDMHRMNELIIQLDCNLYVQNERLQYECIINGAHGNGSYKP